MKRQNMSQNTAFLFFSCLIAPYTEPNRTEQNFRKNRVLTELHNYLLAVFIALYCKSFYLHMFLFCDFINIDLFHSWTLDSYCITFSYINSMYATVSRELRNKFTNISKNEGIMVN